MDGQPVSLLLRVDLVALDTWKPSLHGAGDGTTETILRYIKAIDSAYLRQSLWDIACEIIAREVQPFQREFT